MIKILSISDDSRLTDYVTEFCAKFPDSRLVGKDVDLGRTFKHLNPYAPNIVLVDLDFFDNAVLNENIFGSEDYDKTFFIGITSKYEMAYKTLIKGFIDVRIKPLVKEELFDALINCRSEIFNRDRVITISSPKDVYFLRVSDVLFLKADNNNVDIYLKDGTILPVFNSLKHFQKKLRMPFLRIQKSYIINVTQICRINRIKNFMMVRKRKERIPFSLKYLNNMDGLESLLRK